MEEHLMEVWDLELFISKRIRKRKITKISRVSGCSIGSIIALFLLNFKYDINKVFISVCKILKTHLIFLYSKII